MEQKVDKKKKIMNAVIWVVVILVLLGTAHIIVSNLDIVGFMKTLHGG